VFLLLIRICDKRCWSGFAIWTIELVPLIQICNFAGSLLTMLVRICNLDH
jgi:hypothetical protein